MNWRSTLFQSCVDKEMGRLVIDALDEFVDRERYLLQVDASERSMAHRLAIYLERRLAGWDVDCEYNRDGHMPKEVHLESDDDMAHGSHVFPDIIVHHRGSGENLLVTEIKKSNSSVADQLDLRKLEAYGRELGYRHRLFVRLQVGEESGVSTAFFIT